MTADSPSLSDMRDSDEMTAKKSRVWTCTACGATATFDERGWLKCPCNCGIGGAFSNPVRPPTDSVPLSELLDEIGWLIEYRSIGNAPTYWAGKKDFTYNHMEAVRFARKEDAERVMHSSGQMVFAVKNLYAVEHMWCPRAISEAAHD